MSIEYENSNMPRQRLAYRKKTKTWRKEVVDSIDKRHTMHSVDNSVRNTTREKYINQRLYEGRVDKEDMVRYINPYDIKGLKIDGVIPHHNIIVQKLNVLMGEEDKRQFDYTVVVTTPNAISKKIEDKAEAVDEKLTKIIEQEFMPQQQRIEQMKAQGQDTQQAEQQLKAQMDEAMQKVTKYAKYTWRDRRELAANRILKHYAIEQSFNRIFNDGFKDALILGEEMYQVDILDNEPLLSKLNPMNVHTVKSGRSSRVEDSDIIVIEDYWSPGKIIDHFYNELKPSEIDMISNEGSGVDNGTSGIRDMDREFTRPHYIGSTGEDNAMNNVNDIIAVAEADGYETPYAIYDEDGNVRVLRAYWRSQKKILKVKYYDEDGATQYKIMSEEYILDEARGEEGETLWINEWWEGTKIARDIYINMRPRRIQYNKLESPSRGGPGIIGELYNTNQGRVVSMVSRMKSYQYLYDSVWDRLMKAIAKNMGKILEVDVAKIPANWDVGQWFHYATTMGIGFVDSFKEGNKGAATGKLAGGFNTTGKVLDVETGNYIQAQIQLLEYIKQEMADLVGISKQREGQVSNRETVGGVERSVMQSSHITEWWFSKHDDVKIRVLQAYIDTAKVALKGSTKKIQYILDDMSIEAFILDGDDFAEIDYGVAVTSNASTRELKQRMDGLVQAGLQNQMLKFSDLLYIYSSNSLADIRRKIEGTEEEKAKEAQAAQKAQQDQLAQQQQQAMQLAEQEQARLDQELELKGADIANDRYKIETDLRVKLMELGMTGQMNEADKDEEKPLDRDKHNETVRHNKKQEDIALKSVNKKSVNAK